MWYDKNYRRVFMDMHLNDSNPEEDLSKLDIEDFVSTLKGANVQNIVVKAKSHVGLHYWKSMYGKMHEGLKRRGLDYVEEMINLCHKNEIGVIVYLSQIYDNYAYENYPSWRIVTKEGKTSREENGRYGLVCPNNKEYQKYIKDILRELNLKYSFEGMFLDMPFWPQVCYCASCRERFWNETGHYIPKDIDLENPVFVEFAYARQRWLKEFLQKITRTVKEINPNVSIEHNFAAIALNWVQGNTEDMIDTCDYAGGDYYGGYLEQSFMCKYYNSITPNKPFSYITSRCDHNLFFHTVSRTEQDLLIHAINALVHGGAFSMCDAMNPDGTITNEIYQNALKSVFGTSSKYEQYVSGNMLTDVSIWFNTNLKYKDNFIKSPLNISEIMREYNIPFNVIGSRNLKELDTQVLSINDVSTVTDDEMADIEEYIKKGGNVFISGCLGHKRFEDLLEIDMIGESEYAYTYLNPTQEGVHLFDTFDKKSPYPIQSKSYKCNLYGKANVLATLSYPYTKPKSRDFAAIHSDPPGIHTNMPAVILKNVDKGKILWIAAPLELTHAHYCRHSVYSLIKSLLNGCKFSSNAPDFIEIVGWTKENKKYFAVINQQQKTPLYPIYNIEIKMEGTIKNARLITPAQEPMKIVEKGNETVFNLPELNTFHIVEILE